MRETLVRLQARAPKGTDGNYNRSENMKKQTKKLDLKIETVRHVAGDKLPEIRGGLITTSTDKCRSYMCP